ncbi:response regulator transcription factor [Paenibacillus pseudetheri]|uniref:Transcriptional regulatory protein ComA n=1 Tax=Paenibacillus pseudetheri TaxID=2897682 RepID=A0ABM9BLT9_9BACL|nr:response regulator transcription factor [Paenibacillus pseudetheri]CAH1059691.1 Transcriptional regulatory protein ComA [Paenibacillus pseudetheri]
MIRILLVDDHPSVGEGTKNMIEQDADMEVTFVLSAMEAFDMLEQQRFDVILCDLNMPTISGIEFTKRAVQRDPESKVVIYTGYEISAHYNLLMESGVTGFISKTASREQLLNTIRCALRNEAVIPVSLLKQLRRNDIKISNNRDNQFIEEVSINQKEQEILQEVASGKSNKDIAGKLLMSQRTVEYNLTRIFEKLSVHSRSEAIVEGKRLGLVRTEQF